MFIEYCHGMYFDVIEQLNLQQFKQIMITIVLLEYVLYMGLTGLIRIV